MPFGSTMRFSFAVTCAGAGASAVFTRRSASRGNDRARLLVGAPGRIAATLALSARR
jgi:hypothetical protein